MSKSYVLRVRQPDGSWEFDFDNPMPKGEANKASQMNRIIGGILCQVWDEEEAWSVFRKSAPPPQRMEG